MESDQPLLTVVHVSDLHLHSPLRDAGRRLKLFQQGIRTHVYFLLQAASEAIQRIAVDAGRDSMVLVVTGDLSTAGSPVALASAYKLITSLEVEEDGTQWPVGLNGGWPVFVVPGNHDRFSGSWINIQQSAFETEFLAVLPRDNWTLYGLDRPTSDVPVYPRLPFVRAVLSAPSGHGPGLALVFIGLDSTELTARERFDLLGRVAKGRVSRESLVYLKNVCNDLRQNREVTDSEGKRHNLRGYTVRTLVLLHHHPFLPPGQEERKLQRLINAEELLQHCAAAEVDALLFGHQHITFTDLVTLGSAGPFPRQLLFACAGSLSVYDEDAGNSFLVHRFSSTSIRSEIWRFSNGLFRKANYGKQVHFD